MKNPYNIETIKIKELIRLIFVYSKRPSIPKKLIQKILWLIKQEIPDDNPIKHQLGFYWYKEGPYSEVISDVVLDMKECEHVQARPDTNFELYRLDSKLLHTQLTSSSEIQEIRPILLDKIKESSNDYSNHQLYKKVYDDGPISFYSDYKSNFLSNFISYCKHYESKSIDKKD